VAPLAVGLITSKAGLLSHLLFAVAERSLGTITTSFTTVLSDSLSFLEDHWEDIITAIEKGILPDILDYGEYRPCLEVRPFRNRSLYSINHPSRCTSKPIPLVLPS